MKLAAILALAILPLYPQEDQLRAFLLSYYKVDSNGAKDFQYEEVRTDLNGDGKQEIVVQPVSQGFCGTGGCPMLVLTQRGKAFGRILWTPIVHPPIRVLERSSHGWKSFAATMCGGGIIQCYEIEFRFDGTRYRSDFKPLKEGAPGRTLITP